MCGNGIGSCNKCSRRANFSSVGSMFLLKWLIRVSSCSFHRRFMFTVKYYLLIYDRLLLHFYLTLFHIDFIVYITFLFSCESYPQHFPLYFLTIFGFFFLSFPFFSIFLQLARNFKTKIFFYLAIIRWLGLNLLNSPQVLVRTIFSL